MDPATARFPEATQPARARRTCSPPLGIPFSESTPANVTFFIALLACVLVWLLIWRTRLGYQIRAFGKSEKAAVYAGISPVRDHHVSPC